MDGHWCALESVNGLWQARCTIRGGQPLRTTALRLADGRLAVYSPSPCLDEQAHAALRSIGTVAFLIAPNSFHHLGLQPFLASHPGASVVAAPLALARLRRKHPALPIGGPSSLQEALPEGAELLLPPGTRNGELWLALHHEGGTTWVVGDAFCNIARTPRTPIGLAMWLLRISPGLRIATTFRLLVADRGAYRGFVLDRLRRDQPRQLVPCHGEIASGDELPARLARRVRERFGG